MTLKQYREYLSIVVLLIGLWLAILGVVLIVNPHPEAAPQLPACTCPDHHNNPQQD